MRLRQKQKAFIAEYVENGGNGVQAALKVYDTDDYNTANQIARDNLQKPTIMREIEKQMTDTGLTVKKAINAINDGYDAEKKGAPDHNVRLRSADMTLKLADAYPRNKEVSHRHAHLHVEMVNELAEKFSFDELTQMVEQEAGLEPGALGPGTDIDIHKLLSPGHLPEREQPVENIFSSSTHPLTKIAKG